MHTTGAIIGVVNVTDCTRTPQGDDAQWHNPGMWAWVLRDPLVLDEPIPATGQLGLFDYDLEMSEIEVK